MAENFVNSVDYVVTAPDGTTKTYTVTVNIGNSSTKDITSFSLTATTPSICRMGVINGWLPVGGGTPTVNTIYVGFDDHNTDVTSLKANFQTSGVTVLAFVNGNWVQQQSNVTINNFTNPITYRVIAENLSYKDYVVSVAVIPAPGGPPSPNFNPTGVCTVLLNN